MSLSLVKLDISSISLFSVTRGLLTAGISFYLQPVNLHVWTRRYKFVEGLVEGPELYMTL